VADEDTAERSLRIEQHIRGLIESLERLRASRAGRSLQWPQPRELTALLFSLLKDGCGEEAARQLFIEQGQGRERREKQEIDNLILLNDYDFEKQRAEASGKRFYPIHFVREYAKANEMRPREEQRGAGGTDSGNLYQHLRVLLRERRKASAAAALQGARSDHAHAKAALAELRRRRKVLVKAGDLTAIRALDQQIEQAQQTITVFSDRVAALQQPQEIESDI
jgi:hypothetical protein